MKVLFDLIAAQPVSGNRFHGAAEYAAAVFKHLAAFGGKRLVAAAELGRPLPQSVQEIAAQRGIEILPARGAASLPLIAARAGADRVYSALPYDYGGLDFAPADLVCTIHGLRPMEMPVDRWEIRYAQGPRAAAAWAAKLLLRKRYVAYKARQFAGIFNCAWRVTVIVDSAHTRRSLETWFPHLDARLTHVIWPPRACVPPAADLEWLGRFGVEPGRFFLLTGANRWIKNALRAVRALDRFFCAGAPGDLKALVLGSPRRPALPGLRNPERFVFNAYVERDVLELLYENAMCFVYPTLNEGFGYPPVECMKYGTPVICSRIPVLREVCADGVLYFDPFSVDQIAQCAALVACNGGVRGELARRGRGRAAQVIAVQNESLERIAQLVFEPPQPATGGGRTAAR